MDIFDAFWDTMVRFAILVLQGSYISSVATTLDIFKAAASISNASGEASPTWSVVSVEGGDVSLDAGLHISTQRLSSRSLKDAILVIPGLGIDSPSALSHFQKRPDAHKAARAVERHVKAGGKVAASCSAVFLLQLAGVLKDGVVTTSWWLAPQLRKLTQDCEVDESRMICQHGAITTAGAAFAQADLCLHLLARECSPKLADFVSRYLILDTRKAQSRYLLPEVLVSGDSFVSQVSNFIEKSLYEVPSVETIASHFGVSGKTLNRRVQKATGRSMLHLIQTIRVRRVQQLLETRKTSIEQIAESVGYKNTSALRRLMQKTLGINPSQYRTRT